MRDYKLVSRVWFPPKWPFQESTTMDSQLTSFSLSYSIEPHVISLPLSNSFAIIQIHPSICVTLETTIHKGGRTSVKKCRFFDVFATDNFRMLYNKDVITYAGGGMCTDCVREEEAHILI